MKILAAVVLSVALALSIATPGGSAERPAALIVRQVSPSVPVHAFDEFYREFNAMLVSWWDHGGRGAARGTWQVVVVAVTLPSEPRTRFIVSVAEERDGAWHLAFTFVAFLPHQLDMFFAVHAAYDAAIGAILGQYRGNRLWLGPGGGETARLPERDAAPTPMGVVPFSFLACERTPVASASRSKKLNPALSFATAYAYGGESRRRVPRGMVRLR